MSDQSVTHTACSPCIWFQVHQMSFALDDPTAKRVVSQFLVELIGLAVQLARFGRFGAISGF